MGNERMRDVAEQWSQYKSNCDCVCVCVCVCGLDNGRETCHGNVEARPRVTVRVRVRIRVSVKVRVGVSAKLGYTRTDVAPFEGRPAKTTRFRV